MFLGRLAGVTQITFAILLAAVASLRFEPGFVPRGLVLVVVFGLPGVIGLLGVANRRSSLLVAAGVASGIGSFVAFSGVTLIFLVPAFMFLSVAVRFAARPADARAGDRGGAGRALRGLVRLVGAAVIVALLVGAGWSALVITDSACWSEYKTATGTRIEVSPFSNGGAVSTTASSTTCSSGLIAAQGVGIGGALAVAGLGLAVAVARRKERGADDDLRDTGEMHRVGAAPGA